MSVVVVSVVIVSVVIVSFAAASSSEIPTSGFAPTSGAPVPADESSPVPSMAGPSASGTQNVVSAVGAPSGSLAICDSLHAVSPATASKLNHGTHLDCHLLARALVTCSRLAGVWEHHYAGSTRPGPTVAHSASGQVPVDYISRATRGWDAAIGRPPGRFNLSRPPECRISAPPRPRASVPILKRYLLLLLGLPCLAIGLTGCASDSAGGASDAVSDTPDATTATSDTLDDSSGPDAAVDDAVVSDAAEPDNDTAEDVAAVATRRWTYQAIGGISMGAAAVNIALLQPERFDIVGGLGGYLDLPYIVTTAQRLQLAGFCDLETLEANIDGLDDPAHDPPTFCGPAPAVEELEAPQDFNHLFWTENGATFDREFYMKVFQGLIMAFGNFTSEPTGESAYLPSGVELEWFANTPREERCVQPPPIAAALAYNAEYNPDGKHPVIPFCDDSNSSDPGWVPSHFDPAAPHWRPIDIALAVDINGNGERDYGEPVFLNTNERYEDVGPDGCASAREDGAGGCLPAGEPDTADADPNGDDFHWWDTPNGGERDGWFQPGEPFDDTGLDGVEATNDTGEGNTTFDMIPSFVRARSFNATQKLRELPQEQLDRMDFYFDSGIRDPLHAAVSTRHVVGVLQGRTQDVTLYQGMSGRDTALFPTDTNSGLLENVFSHDLSAEALGRHVYVEYGDADASPELIEKGDGGHVGTIEQAIARLVTYIAFAAMRFPNPDLGEVVGGDLTFGEARNFYSHALQARRRYTVALPPGYHDAKNADRTYPVLYFLHGLGQDAADLGPAALITSNLMRTGVMPKILIVFPDGACCDVDTRDGTRHCACRPVGGDNAFCIDPTCEGDEESCEEIKIPKQFLEEECNRGSLFYDLLTDKWAEPRDDLGYQSMVYEVVDDVSARYRVRSPADLPVED